MTATILSVAGQPRDAAPTGPAADPVCGALMDSRLRWRDFVGIAADLAFETDIDGRFTFIWPDPALGWSAAALMGEPSSRLLHRAGETVPFDPFRPPLAIRRQRAWLRRPDGRTVCLALSAAPIRDASGQVVGSRGIGQDVTEQDHGDCDTAARLRRGEVLHHILWRIRQEVMAPRMMQAALNALRDAVAAEGVAVIDAIAGGTAPPTVLHHAGQQAPSVLAPAAALLEQGAGAETAMGVSPCGRALLLCLCQTRFGDQAALLLWRAPGGRGWDVDDTTLMSVTTGIVRVVLEHEAIQREMALQARTDSLTGLLNRRSFLDELARRMDRLDRDGLPGTLMFVDLDNFKRLNDCCGHEAGDDALCVVAGLLRNSVRPTDLVARLGGDEFAMWLDGTDELSAAERAEMLRVESPARLGQLGQPYDVMLGMSIGIATRWPGRSEDIETLIHRADQAMYDVKRNGRGHWKVSQADVW